MDSHDSLRRKMVAAIASLPILASGVDASDKLNSAPSKRILVAYFSRSGNTRVIAGLIHRSHNSELFELKPATPYPEDYLETVDQAQRETANQFKPPLEDDLRSLENSDVIFLGFPIWGETTPPVVRSFLSAHDFSGKIIVPFITHGGYGVGNSLSVIRKAAPNAEIIEGFVMQGEQERKTMEAVKEWLGGLKV
ncbi:flavodoxin [Pseudomonas syringae]|nr:flavodoxin [Pseudomonas syringae]